MGIQHCMLRGCIPLARELLNTLLEIPDADRTQPRTTKNTPKPLKQTAAPLPGSRRAASNRHRLPHRQKPVPTAPHGPIAELFAACCGSVVGRWFQSWLVGHGRPHGSSYRKRAKVISASEEDHTDRPDGQALRAASREYEGLYTRIQRLSHHRTQPYCGEWDGATRTQRTRSTSMTLRRVRSQSAGQ